MQYASNSAVCPIDLCLKENHTLHPQSVFS